MTAAETYQDRRESRSRYEQKVSEAVRFLSARFSSKPEIALILGSGLGALADSLEDAVSVETLDIPHFPVSTVSGHRGRLVAGTLGGRRVLVVQGRIHMYEGYGIDAVVFPVRLVHALGAGSLFVTNAAGGINRRFHPGTLMWITDHVNWTGTRPVPTSSPASDEAGHAGSDRVWCRRASSYDLEWTERSAEAALKAGIRTDFGTYLWTRGPSYETQAEIGVFSRIGADAVGMSTVPEVLQAAQLGMHVIGLSTITNLATGLGSEPLDHKEVLDTGRKVQSDLEKIAVSVLKCAPGVAGGE